MQKEIEFMPNKTSLFNLPETNNTNLPQTNNITPVNTSTIIPTNPPVDTVNSTNTYDDTTISSNLNITLMPHQKEALEFLRKNKYKGYIYLDTGQGKTLIAVLALKEANAKSALIITSNSAISSWKKELSRVGIPETNYTILTYGIFSHGSVNSQEYISLFEKTDFLILDEAHNIKDPKTTRSKLILKYFMNKNIPKILLSATPMNDYTNLYTQFKLLEPKLFGSWKDFINTYFVEKELTNIKGASFKKYEIRDQWAETELLTKINYLIFRKEPTETKKRSIYFHKIPTPEEYSWKNYIKTIVQEIKEELINSTEGDESLIDEDLFYMRLFEKIKGKFIHFWRCASINNHWKHELIRKYLQNPKGKKIIVYTFFREEADIYASMTDCYLVTGDTTKKQRAEIIAKQDKHIIMTSAMSESADLDKYNFMILATVPSTIQKFKQTTGRIDRLSNKANKLIYIIPMDEYNERLYNLLRNKQNLDNKVRSIVHSLKNMKSIISKEIFNPYNKLDEKLMKLFERL